MKPSTCPARFQHPPWPPSPGRRLPRLLPLVILGVALCTLQPATATTPTPDQVKKAQSARLAMTRLDDLQRQAGRTKADASALDRRGREIAAAWLRFMEADEALIATLKRAEDCLPVLQQRLQANEGAMRTLQASVARSQAAVESLARSGADALPGATRSADTAFTQRKAAESGLTDTNKALRQQASQCAQSVRAAQWEQYRTEGLAQSVADQARALGPDSADLRARWVATATAFDAATRARWLNAPAPALAPPDPGPMARLTVALSDLKGLDASSRTRLQPAGPLTPQRDDLERLWADLTRLQDAASYVATAIDPAAGGCEGEACQVFAAEQQTLTTRIADAQTRLTQATDQWIQAPDALLSQWARTRTERQALADRLAPVGLALAPAVAEARRDAQAIADASHEMSAAAQPAYEKARREWTAAHRRAYGRAPEVKTGQTASLAGEGQAMAEAPAMAMMAPDIRSHAYHLFSRFDGEIAGFGAYTYVLVRSASDMAKPPVQRRFQKLLSTLQQLPDATLVPADQAKLVNVFCVPVQPGAEEAVRPGELRYASDLGQQLKLRAQNGLLTQRSVQHRLTNAPGPFLITLPMRLAQAQSTTPVLIADLSTYPEDAIADLATHYMNGLVDDFPRQQTLWKPPKLQQVALFMIHLAEATGQLVESAMPTALAGPR
jgi:hypothetical protein